MRSKRLLFNGLSSTNCFTNFSKSRPPRISSSLCPPPQRDSRFGEETCGGFVDERFLFRVKCLLCVFARYYEDQSVLSFLSSPLLNSVKRRINKKCVAECARQKKLLFLCSFFWSCVLTVFSSFFSLFSLSLSLSLCCSASLYIKKKDEKTNEAKKKKKKKHFSFFYSFRVVSFVLSLSLSLC